MIRSRLKLLRNKKGYSQEEIAKRLGMARTTYAGYENGSRDPDPETLRKIAEYHNVSVDYILGRDTINDQARNDAIDAYNRLPPDKKKIVDDLINVLIDNK